MPSARIQEMFSEGVGRNREPSQRQLELEALLPEYAARLSRRGVTVKTLYEEYRETHPDGIQTCQFRQLSHALPYGDTCRRPCRALCRRPDVYRLRR